MPRKRIVPPVDYTIIKITSTGEEAKLISRPRNPDGSYSFRVRLVADDSESIIAADDFTVIHEGS